MNKCLDCMMANLNCACGRDGLSITDQLDHDLRLRRPYPSKIILGSDIFETIVKEMHQTHSCGLMVNLEGKYKKLFGMKIEIDDYCRLRIAYGYDQSDQEGDCNE